MTNLRNPAILVRYASRLLGLWIGWFVSVLSVSGATFSALGSQGSLVAFALLTAIWLAHVAQSVAEKGDLDPVPPAAVAAPQPVVVNVYNPAAPAQVVIEDAPPPVPV